MKIQELNLVAFGPFTDRALFFNQEEAGLQIIYGSNESGVIKVGLKVQIKDGKERYYKEIFNE